MNISTRVGASLGEAIEEMNAHIGGGRRASAPTPATTSASPVLSPVAAGRRSPPCVPIDFRPRLALMETPVPLVSPAARHGAHRGDEEPLVVELPERI